MINFLPYSTEFRINLDREDYFLFFGRLSFEKGILTLIKAFSKMPGSAVLKIAGNGPQFGEIEDYLKQNNLENRIQLLGFKEREQMDHLIRKAKCVVVPSEWYENGPYTVMETLAKGVPVIASSNGGLPEMIIDGYNGYLFKAGNGEELLRKMKMVSQVDKKTYEKLCLNALNFAKEEFQGEKYIKDIIKVYVKLINGSNKELGM
ncbi:glycosyltransferase [Desulfosporosinus sp. SB140]|uniref:glycosyltransferase n=1 Tax=Desulfosporosinus paludis TaxID=3115649 RepID=UPI00388E74B2